MPEGRLAASPGRVATPPERKRSAQPGGRPALRVLVASHSHPAVSKGGGEIAAFALFQALRARDGCRAWFLGCDRTLATDRPGAVLGQPFSDDEYLYCTGAFDWFKFANPDPRFPAEAARLFARLAPDVVHFHHYINFGVEVFHHLRRAVPACRIVLTLHEYLAICHHYGQMVTATHRTLCSRSGPRPCHDCFPEHPRSDFYLRRRYIERFFGLVDQFTAPSRFLAARYVEWGIPASKIAVLDNLTVPAPPAPTVAPSPEEPLRVGFFGQISDLKGIGVLLDAAAALDRDAAAVGIDIFGDYRGQPPSFQAGFLERLAKVGPNVRFHGPYDPADADRLMRTVHAVVVPSVWWENAPLVIAEALRNRRPVLCSDIGGMAEKVREGLDGFHFPAGSAVALAGLLRRLARDRGPLLALAARMTGEPAVRTTLDDYLRLYRAAQPGGACLPPAPAPSREGHHTTV